MVKQEKYRELIENATKLSNFKEIGKNVVYKEEKRQPFTKIRSMGSVCKQGGDRDETT